MIFGSKVLVVAELVGELALQRVLQQPLGLTAPAAAFAGQLQSVRPRAASRSINRVETVYALRGELWELLVGVIGAGPGTAYLLTRPAAWV
jgi:hypothetical protein